MWLGSRAGLCCGTTPWIVVAVLGLSFLLVVDVAPTTDHYSSTAARRLVAQIAAKEREVREAAEVEERLDAALDRVEASAEMQASLQAAGMRRVRLEEHATRLRDALTAQRANDDVASAQRPRRVPHANMQAPAIFCAALIASVALAWGAAVTAALVRFFMRRAFLQRYSGLSGEVDDTALRMSVSLALVATVFGTEMGALLLPWTEAALTRVVTACAVWATVVLGELVRSALQVAGAKQRLAHARVLD